MHLSASFSFFLSQHRCDLEICQGHQNWHESVKSDEGYRTSFKDLI